MAAVPETDVWVSLAVTQVSVLMARATDDAPHIGHHPDTGSHHQAPVSTSFFSLSLSCSVLCGSDWE